MSHPTTGARQRRRPEAFRRLALALSACASIGSSPVAASAIMDAGRAANERVGERLERVRDPDIAPPRVDISLHLDRSEDERRIEEWNGLTPRPADDRFEQTALDPSPALQRELHLLSNGVANDAAGYWSRGTATLTPNRQTGQDEMSLTGGFDGSGGEGWIWGSAASFDARRFGDAGADFVGLSVYGSVPIGASAFLDLTSGAVSSSRGTRHGTLVSGTARFGFEHRFSGWLVNPYGRAELYAGNEDPTAPSGRLVTGLRIERRIDWGGLRLRSQFRWEAERRRSPGSVGLARTRVLAPAVLVDLAPDWTARVEYRDQSSRLAREGQLAFGLSGKW